MKNVVVPETINAISEMAFQDCSSLETIRFTQYFGWSPNEDGTINISGATAIQMYSAELQTGYPIGQVMTKLTF